ncbi:recombinase family protein [Pseudarthrobacter scleromae]|uniref:recombinase family protein n=1 Tax=Pseudarthrobacter scleromae TaxID=158897 RepID=UPI003D05CC43
MKAAWYGRVSSAGQVDHGSSLTTQQEQCEGAIKARGWTLAGKFVDEGLSGAKNDRPQWQALLAACRSGEVQAVVVASLDRLARNASHAIQVTDELEQLGVTLVILREQVDLGTPAGRMMRTVLAGVAEMERDLIRARSVTGQRAKLARSGWPGGQPSYGWRLDGKGKDARPVPDTSERDALAYMVKSALAGRTTGEIARELNRQGVPTRSGAEWSHTVVRRMLRNPALVTGEHHWGHVGKTGDRYYKTQADARSGKPKHGDPVVIELPEPPLDRETFDALQQVLDAAPRSGQRQDNQQRQWLSTRVHGTCGRHYLGVLVLERSGVRRPIYRPECKRRPKAGQPDCDCRQIDVARLDAAVWAEVVGVLGDRERLLKLAAEWTRSGTSSQSDAQEAERLGEQARKLTRAIQRATDEAFMADEPEELLARVAKYRAQLADVRAKLEALQSTGPEARGNARQLTELAALADRAAERLQSFGEAERLELAELLDLRVEVAGPLVAGLPESVTVRGVLDPRAQ